MDQTVIITIELRHDVSASSFDAYFQEAVRAARSESEFGESVTISLYAPVETGTERVWVTRFPEQELRRVSRADWPFVILALRSLLIEIRKRFAADLQVAVSPVLSAQGLADQWNEEHGRFHKLTLDS